jgi:hypothetical protein
VAARLKTTFSSICRVLSPSLTALGGPQAEPVVPQRAVGVGVPRVGQGREVPEHVEQVSAVAQGVDQRGVAGRGVLAGVPVQNEVLEALPLRVAGARLAVDEPEQPLPCGAEEVIAAVERRVVEGGHVGGPPEHRGRRLARIGAEVDDRLAGEALHEQQVGPRLRELAGLALARDVDAEHPVCGVGVAGDIEWAVAGRDDRRVVDGGGAGDADERAVAGSGYRPG